MKRILLGLFLGCAIACSKTGGGGSSGTKYVYPAPIATMCTVERDNARGCIQSVGTKTSERARSLTVVVRKGEKRINGYWSWRSPEWKGIWVCGLTHDAGGGNYVVEVGGNPQTGGEVNAACLRHEHGHFWLLSNGVADSHPPQYRGCFFNWNDPGVGVRSTQIVTNGVVMDGFIDEE